MTKKKQLILKNKAYTWTHKKISVTVTDYSYIHFVIKLHVTSYSPILNIRVS